MGALLGMPCLVSRIHAPSGLRNAPGPIASPSNPPVHGCVKYGLLLPIGRFLSGVVGHIFGARLQFGRDLKQFPGIGRGSVRGKSPQGGGHPQQFPELARQMSHEDLTPDRAAGAPGDRAWLTNPYRHVSRSRPPRRDGGGTRPRHSCSGERASSHGRGHGRRSPPSAGRRRRCRADRDRPRHG